MPATAGGSPESRRKTQETELLSIQLSSFAPFRPLRPPLATARPAMDSSLHASQLCFRGPAEICPGSHRKMAKTEEDERTVQQLGFPVSPVTSGHHSSGQARGRTPSTPWTKPLQWPARKRPVVAGIARNPRRKMGSVTVHVLFIRAYSNFPAIEGYSGNLRPPVTDPKHPPTSGRLW